jgi:hypothetical protein
MSTEIIGCSDACARNSNVSVFTRDYRELLKRLPRLAVLS